MVADGKNLWFYDRDLEQVSVKPAAAALTATPASLLSGDGNIRELFTVRADGKRDGLDWVLVTPKTQRRGFSRGAPGVQGAGAELQAHGAQGQARPDGAARFQAASAMRRWPSRK